MELNNIQLNTSLLTSLYRNTIVEIPQKPEPADQPVPTSSETTRSIDSETVKFLGENKKSILVIVNYENAVYLPDEPLSLLTAILGACGLNLGDVALVNYQTAAEKNYKFFLSGLKSRIVLFFGLKPQDLGLPVNFPEYQIQPLGGSTFLYGPSLEELEADKILKSKLWVALRRLFAV